MSQFLQQKIAPNKEFGNMASMSEKQPTRVLDQMSRPLRDLRISLTDRCNFRCTYCMPKEIFGANYQFLPRAETLRQDEIIRLITLFNHLGVHKIRLTGGEPLLRRDIIEIVQRISDLKLINDLAITTNGSLLPQYAAQLKNAGLNRLTVSLDALDPQIAESISGGKSLLPKTLQGVEAALEASIPIKLNCVIQKGVNESEIIPLVTFSREKQIPIRFIEYMDVGMTNQWNHKEVVPSSHIKKLIHDHFPLIPSENPLFGETATRFSYLDNNPGEIGFISSITQPFCSDCTRARISTKGELFTCLFASKGHDLKTLLRSGMSDQSLIEHFQNIWHHRKDRYSEQRSSTPSSQTKAEMSYLGG